MRGVMKVTAFRARPAHIRPMPGSIDLHDARLFGVGDLEGDTRLQEALRRLASRLSAMTGVDCQCLFAGVEALRLPGDVERTCYFVCGEALDNAARHALARHVMVELAARHGKLVLRIGDDGEGFAPGERSGRGLATMAARVEQAGGRFELRSAPGAGTCVSALFPLATPAEPTHAGRATFPQIR
jgi:signal transduction histidine kinase